MLLQAPLEKAGEALVSAVLKPFQLTLKSAVQPEEELFHIPCIEQ